MKIVECIANDFNFSERVQKFIDLGEPYPEIGKEYIVIGDWKREDGTVGYSLKEFDWSELGLSVYWNVEKFKTVSDEFIVNSWDEILGCCEVYFIVREFKF